MSVTSYNGADIRGLLSHRLIALGIALVPEGRSELPRLTVGENIDMGAYCRNDKPEIRADHDHVFTLFPRLAGRRRQAVGTLSGGEQNAKLALEMCDRGDVMESGEITVHDQARALFANRRVRCAYPGE